MSAINLKAQAAFAAFFQVMQSMGVSELADMTYPPNADKPDQRVTTIHPALTGTRFELPNLIARAENKFEELAPGCNVWNGEVNLIISSSLEDDKKAFPNDPEGASLHGARARAVFQLLFDVSKSEADPVARAWALPFLNQPAEGPDSRMVKDFTCSCYTFADELNGWDEHHVETTLVIRVTCSHGDPS